MEKLKLRKLTASESYSYASKNKLKDRKQELEQTIQKGMKYIKKTKNYKYDGFTVKKFKHRLIIWRDSSKRKKYRLVYKGNPVTSNSNRIVQDAGNGKKKKSKSRKKKRRDNAKKKKNVEHLPPVDISNDGHHWHCQKTPCTCDEGGSDTEIIPEVGADFD